jgi:hypothetical protein
MQGRRASGSDAHFSRWWDASKVARNRDLEALMAALQASAERIRKHRRRMTLADAEDIVQMEFERRAIDVSKDVVEFNALMFHRSPVWPLLHPIQARRERRRSATTFKVAMDEADAGQPPGDGPSYRYRSRGHE